MIGDIHANLEALRVALEYLERAEVERVLVTGDLVGYGPQPNECVEMIAALNADCVAGNHDLIALGLLSDARCIALARQSLRWTQRVLSADSRAFLGTLPLRAQHGHVVIAHGSLDDPQEYVSTGPQAARDLGRLQTEDPAVRCLLLGHTHRPAAFDVTGTRLPRGSAGIVALPTGPALLNPGAVGQSRELRARVRLLVLDLGNETATFEALPYDLAECRRSLRRNGLSPRGCHLRPSPLRGGARRLRRLRRLWPGAGGVDRIR